MDSVASTSSPPNHHPRRPRTRFKPTQPFADRILRAFHHHLRLLHRRDSNFFVLGATGNVYTVSLSATPSCTCPDRTTPCKHIFFVFIRALGLPLDDACLRRRTLRPCQVNRLLGLPTLPEALAAFSLRERFHQLFFQGSSSSSATKPRHQVEIEEGSSCPVCLEEMAGKQEKVVACGTCRNPIHEECLMTWKRSSGGRSASCVICRARWKDINRIMKQDKYLNLAAYYATNHDQDDIGNASEGLSDDGSLHKEIPAKEKDLCISDRHFVKRLLFWVAPPPKMEEEHVTPPNGDNLSQKVVAVAAGEAHTLALTGDGFVYSWGRGMFGRLGTGSESDELAPVRIKFNDPRSEEGARLKFVGVAAGAYHSLALAGQFMIAKMDRFGAGVTTNVSFIRVTK
ncbi:hypothetical protein ACFX13_044082 [Malus domestica]